MKSITIQFLLYFYLSVSASVALASGNLHEGHEYGNDDGVGQPGLNSNVGRTVEIEMNDDMRYVPDHLTVKEGETVRFLLKNVGEIEHEFVLGTEKELIEHYEVMQKNPEMEHEDANQTRVTPGQAGEVIWQFTKSGEVGFGCLMPGHYESGMKGAVSVEAAVITSNGKETINDSPSGHHH
jgi:uncharacterized cupredoxin-like copper-binding protein